MKPRKTLRRHPGRLPREESYEHWLVAQALKQVPIDPEAADDQELEARISATNARYERYLVASAERQAKAGGQS